MGLSHHTKTLTIPTLVCLWHCENENPITAILLQFHSSHWLVYHDFMCNPPSHHSCQHYCSCFAFSDFTLSLMIHVLLPSPQWTNLILSECHCLWEGFHCRKPIHVEWWILSQESLSWGDPSWGRIWPTVRLDPGSYLIELTCEKSFLPSLGLFSRTWIPPWIFCISCLVWSCQ